MGKEATYRRKGIVIATMAATIASINHNNNANMPAHGPNAGTQIATQSWMSVAKPIVTVPRKRECTGSFVMTVQISGQMMYLSKARMVKIPKRVVFSMKKKIINRCSSHLACHGRACNSTPQIPVPMTE
jgi:hypothetical protein